MEGLYNFIIKKDPVEAVAEKRLSICQGCPSLDRVGTDCAVKGTEPCCAICGCSLALKLRSMDSACPHPDGPKWKEVKL